MMMKKQAVCKARTIRQFASDSDGYLLRTRVIQPINSHRVSDDDTEFRGLVIILSVCKKRRQTIDFMKHYYGTVPNLNMIQQ